MARSKQIAIRMTEEEIAMLDVLVREMQTWREYEAIRLTRSAVLRILLLKELE